MEMMPANTLTSLNTFHIGSSHTNKTNAAERVTRMVSGDDKRHFQILLVAKEQHERQSICNSLQDELNFPISYLEANHGKHALQIIRQEEIDLVIFEDNNVDINSLEFMGRLNKSEKSKIPVIVILNSGAEKKGLIAMKLGAHAYLLKDNKCCHVRLLPIFVSRVYASQQAISSMCQTAAVNQTLVDSIPSVIYKLSLQGGQHDVHISPQVSELGLSADKWGNDAELHHRMCHEEDRPAVKKELEHCFKTGSEFRCEYRINTVSNHFSWFHDHAKIVRDKNGQPLFLQGVMIDIAHRKSLEAELANYRCMIDKIISEKTEKLNKRLAILESCNSNLSDNYHKMHQMYLNLWIMRYGVGHEQNS